VLFLSVIADVGPKLHPFQRHLRVPGVRIMSFADLLLREAGQMAATLKKSLPGVIDEKRRLERSQPQSGHAERLAFLTREAQTGLSGPARLAAYQPDTTRHPDCPYCWMIKGRHVPLLPALGSPGIVACRHCGGRYIEWL
jgi:hypothetical protein